MPDTLTSLRPASIEAALAKLSNTDEIACKGGIVALITTTNGGSSARYNGFSGISESLAAALAYEDTAVIPIADKAALDVLQIQIREIVADNQSVLTAHIRAFHFGSKILDVEY